MGVSASAPSALLLLFLVAGVAAGNVAGHCNIPALAAEVVASCAPAGVPTLTAPCCRALLSAGDLGCICGLGNNKTVTDAGLILVDVYKNCGGVRPLDDCKGSGHGTTPSATANRSPAGINATEGVPAAPPQQDAGVPAAPPSSASAVVINENAGVPTTPRQHDAGVHPPSSASTIVTNVTASLTGLGAMKLPSTCNVHLLASTIIEECTDKLSPTDRCCIPVVAAVDIRECLCAVADDSSIIDAGEDWSAKDIMQLYRICGGIRNLPQSVSAACKSEPIPPPSPPTTHESCELKKKDEHIILGFEVTQGVEVLALIAFAVYKVYCKYSKPPQV
ncbi:hypothetical protein EJB05_47611, partial [Eragrostis curvula]